MSICVQGPKLQRDSMCHCCVPSLIMLMKLFHFNGVRISTLSYETRWVCIWLGSELYFRNSILLVWNADLTVKAV